MFIVDREQKMDTRMSMSELQRMEFKQAFQEFDKVHLHFQKFDKVHLHFQEFKKGTPPLPGVW